MEMTQRRAGATTGRGETAGLKDRLLRKLKPLADFWAKVNNDGVFNLSGLLAYNLLVSIFPILLVLLAVAGFVLNALSPATYHALQRAMDSALPHGATLLAGVTENLARSAGIVLILGLLTSLFGGSRLFITIEYCFGIVFRLRGRAFLQQNLMAIGMLLLYVVLVPFVALASILPPIIVHVVFPGGNTGFAGFLIQVGGIGAGVVAAIALFGAIYVVVPNRRVRWREVWRGTLVGAALFVIYEILFPVYEAHFLKPNNLGSTAGFALVILVFFYYMAFILLLGAEVNSWASGQRQTAGDLPAVLHEVQAHNTTRGAAGPTAGSQREDMRSGAGKAAMDAPARAVEHEREEHHTDVRPPKYAEAGDEGPADLRPRTPQARTRTQEAEREVGGGRKPDDPHQRLPERATDNGRAAHTATAYAGTRPDDPRPASPRRRYPPAARLLASASLLVAGFLAGRRLGGWRRDAE